MTKYKMIDLCSGLKGASQPFIDCPDWEVFTIDINPILDPDLCIDIIELSKILEEIKEVPTEDITLIWASPECIEFYKVLAPFHKDDYGNEPDMSLVNACLKIIDFINPKYWVLENTQSGSIFIKKILGNYRQKLGPFFLWGNFPLLNCKVDKKHKYNNDTWSDNPLRSNIKAKLPYEVGENLRNNITNQNSLESWGLFVEEEYYQP
tara:strand:+ start:1253 stop:1873 length:621 start_codon:yes stop_codon:yes gene_type:complete